MAAVIKTPLFPNAYTPGNRRMAFMDITPSTSYPALGEPITAADFGLGSLDAVICADNSQTTALHAKYDPTNKSIRLYTSSTGAEVGTSSDQSGSKYRLVAFGL